MTREQLYKQNEKLRATLVKYIDKVALKENEINNLNRIIERMRRKNDPL